MFSMPSHNVDELLIPKTQPEVANVIAVAEESAVEGPSDVPITEEPEKLSYLEQFKKDKEDYLNENKDEAIEKPKINEPTPEIKDEKEEIKQNLDEYGNEITKPRMYSEEEVREMIRDRLRRGKHGQEQSAQTTQQQVQQAAQDFQADPNSNDNWEQQLENFVEKTFVKMTQKTQEQQWKAQEEQLQTQFEEKFNVGMAKYKDFHDVVANQTITNPMLMATRSMSDPAAFLYAASKQQAKELSRIAQLPDPFQQATEMGRLEERMRKAKTTSSAPKPLSKTTSDMSDKVTPKRDLDYLIRQDASRKHGRR